MAQFVVPLPDTISIKDLLEALVAREIGDWDWPSPSDPTTTEKQAKQIHRAIAAAEEALLNGLRSSALHAHVFCESERAACRLPVDFWHQEVAPLSLHGRIFELSAGHLLAKEWDGMPVVVPEEVARSWLSQHSIGEDSKFLPSSLRRPQTTTSKKRRSRFDWKSFEAEAFRQLDAEGEYVGEWSQAALIRRMYQWLQKQWWEVEPSESTIKNHIRQVEKQFRKERQEGN